MPKTSGIVHLVGAGPGDPGLVTLRARQLIETADVLVYDYLVHPELLSWCRPDCEKTDVGKRPHLHAVPQEEIETLLVRHARTGKMVVRLKGGDPFVFGRGGEEARALALAAIPFTVVPGVTAALAAGAFAGIPLTRRNTSSSVVFLTGHEDPTKHELQIDWRAYGALPNATLAIYMGMGHLPRILGELVAGGLPSATPAAAVQWASLGRQRSVVGTVATLAGLVERAALAAPAVVLIGEVVADHVSIGWFERLPLHGRRVAITRTRDQNSRLRERLEALGAEVLELPLIRVTPQVDRDELIDIFAELGSYDWIVFTSANGVRFFFEHFLRGFQDLRALGLLRFAAVGEATVAEIARYRVKVECQPGVATAAALADALIATGSLENAKVVVVTGNLNRDTLAKKLMEEGRAIVDCLSLYRTEPADLAADPAAREFRERGADAILFASSSAAENFAQQAGSLQIADGMPRPLCGSIGPQTGATMKKLGLRVDFSAREPGLDGLLAALVAALEPRSRRR